MTIPPPHSYPRLKSRARFVVATLLALSLAFAACDDDNDVVNDEPPNGETVTIDNRQFAPTSLTVSAGDSIVFDNQDNESHTITVDGETVSDTLTPGDSFVFTADEPGEYQLGCDFHPEREATLTVE